MTTIKTITLDDYYAPAFRVPVIPAEECRTKLHQPRTSYTPLFRTTHPEPWRPGANRLAERRRRFTALSRA